MPIFMIMIITIFIYYINWNALQRFPPLRKTIPPHMKNCDNISCVFEIMLIRAQLFKAQLSKSWISGNFNYLFTVKGGFFSRLRFKKKKCVIYNLIRPQFCGKSSFNGKINSN